MKTVASRPIAFVSDVHGNLPALDAVLEAMAERDVSDLCVAGDLVLGGDEPLATWQRLRSANARCTRGLSDAALCQLDEDALRPRDEAERMKAERFLATRSALGDLVLERLRRLPERLRIPMIDGREIVMVHGSPADPTREISHDLSDEEIMSLVADDPADIVVCGASHVPFVRVIDDVIVANVGSVGQAPEGRVAHYTIVTPRMQGAEILQLWADY